MTFSKSHKQEKLYSQKKHEVPESFQNQTSAQTRSIIHCKIYEKLRFIDLR